jgi:hypothetical protein
MIAFCTIFLGSLFCWAVYEISIAPRREDWD